MKEIIISIMLMLFGSEIQAQSAENVFNFKTNKSKTEIWYENTIEVKGKSKQELYGMVEDILKGKGFYISHKNDNSIYATDRFLIKYTTRMLMFYNNTQYRCVYDMRIDFKDEKIRYKADDFILLVGRPSKKGKNVNVAVNSKTNLAVNPDEFTAKTVPLDIVSIPLNSFMTDNPATGKYKHLFRIVDEHMISMEKGMILTDW